MSHNHVDILWPCELDEQTKIQLMSIVKPITGIAHFVNRSELTNQRRGVYYVRKGIVAIAFSPEGPNSMNSGILSHGLWIGGGVMMGQQFMRAAFEEIEPLELFFFQKDKIEQLAESNPFIYKWLYYGSLDTQKIWISAQVASLHDKEVRIVSALLDLLNRSKTIKGSVPEIKVSQKQLSIITGISRPRLNEVLKLLESSQEITLARGKIYLTDLEALTKRTKALDIILPKNK
ncbi:Crp/Fnr family transcriptional regulator [Vibrio tapetis subsp. quintayensis]|uniref:Crp/Fnr family transcriptional regulator n=1 Tax=Vibrio tapetis TaxID=52443 RepID=UPI0025B505C0|nr:Crp/Fnr family transcriptional regulator [Vibrio tapetis]MDN3681037.1 Crp/Fnr family transcriptional regulator [Vibrio tapetis subsp. quintayensis]